MTDPYRAAIDVLAQVGAGHARRRNRAAEVAPDFVRSALGFGYGEILARPGLDLRTRALALVAAEAALAKSADRLRDHVAAALHLGWCKSEIIEVLIQSATHAGVLAALDALSDCHDLLVEPDPASQPCDDIGSSDGQV